MKKNIIERLPVAIAAAATLWLATACEKEKPESAPHLFRPVTLSVTSGDEVSKSNNPADDGIWDLNVFLYDCFGLLEYHGYFTYPEPVACADIPLETAIGRQCSIFVFANSGFRMKDYELDEILTMEYYMAYPDEYPKGTPQSGSLTGYRFENGEVPTLKLKRLLARLSVKIDRSDLDPDVEMFVYSVKVGNCPKCVRAFGTSRANTPDNFFGIGFAKEGSAVQGLNLRHSDGTSDEVDLYLMENMQGALEASLCSYVELAMDYNSDTWCTAGGKELTYRFYIRGNDNFNVERNCHYHLTVHPEGSGLECEDKWRVDKSGLTERDDKAYLKILPEGTELDGTFYSHYYTMGPESILHFTLARFPSSMKVRLREDLVEDEANEGRALYIMDADGNGFTVKALGKNCVSIMELIPDEPLGEDGSETIVISIG